MTVTTDSSELPRTAADDSGGVRLPTGMSPAATLDRAAWLADRRKGVGASDVAGILGLSPWATPYSVWADKVYGSDDDHESEAMAFGRRAEAMVAEWFHEKTGLYVGGQQQRCQWVVPHHMCTIDGRVYESKIDADHHMMSHADPLGALEIKTTSATPKDWEDDGIPIQYQCQGQWTMHVTGLDHLWFAVLHLAFGRPDLVVYELARDEGDIDLIVKAVDTFWTDHVLTGVPPDTDHHIATTYATRHLPANVGDAVDVPDVIAEMLTCLAIDKAAVKHTQLEIDDHENAIRAALGTATEGFHNGLLVVSHRPQSRAGIDAAAFRGQMPATAAKFATTSTYRVLRSHSSQKKKK